MNDSLLSLLLADERESLKIPATGLKLFERHELRGRETGKCQYRIAQVTLQDTADPSAQASSTTTVIIHY